MNRYETWFCGTRLWRWVTRRQVLPWILQGSQLGEHVLELGAGPGAATEELRRLAARVTSLEYDHAFAAKLGAREWLECNSDPGRCGDAALCGRNIFFGNCHPDASSFAFERITGSRFRGNLPGASSRRRVPRI